MLATRMRMAAAGGVEELWTPASPTTDGGLLPHTWEVPGVENYQDAAKTTVAGVGDVVGAVVNQGSDTHDITQATTAAKPTLQEVTINTVTSRVWRVDGTDDYLRGAFGGGLISQPRTVFAVAQLDATAVNDGNNRTLLDGDDNDRQSQIIQYPIPNPDVWAVWAGALAAGGASDGGWSIWSALYNGANSQFWRNGTSEATGNAGLKGLDGLTVGMNSALANPWKGDIGPILIYTSNLSTADKNEIGEYLERVTGIAWTTIV